MRVGRRHGPLGARQGPGHLRGRDDARRPVRFVGTVQDITARKDAEAQLQEAKEAAETASLAKDRFLAVLSHELRTPLAPVVTAVALLEMTQGLPPEVQEYLAMIRRNIALETRLIDDLLDLSRVISGKFRLDRRPTHINDLVEHVLDILGGEVHDKGLTVETTLGARPDLVDADPARLQQVVWNLVQNAAKFTPAGGTIAVATRSTAEGRVEVEVRDTGKGISPEALPSIFNAFEQGDPAITRQFGGLGLGLSIAKAVMDRHGGTIRAASDGPGRGSSFVVALPQIRPPADRPDDVAAPPADGPAGRIRVLLVEDHVDTARAMVRLLERSRLQGRVGRWRRRGAAPGGVPALRHRRQRPGPPRRQRLRADAAAQGTPRHPRHRARAASAWRATSPAAARPGSSSTWSSRSTSPRSTRRSAASRGWPDRGADRVDRAAGWALGSRDPRRTGRHPGGPPPAGARGVAMAPRSGGSRDGQSADEGPHAGPGGPRDASSGRMPHPGTTGKTGLTGRELGSFCRFRGYEPPMAGPASRFTADRPGAPVPGAPSRPPG